MRIAQVSPLHESVPPKSYGGTERIVHYLTEELVRQGHEVTLFASGDSRTSADLCAVIPESLRLSKRAKDPVVYHLLQLTELMKHVDRFDVIHFHTDFLHYPLCRQISVPYVTTLHGRLDLADLKPIYEEFRDIPVISISDSQRQPLPEANWLATVYNGVPAETYQYRERSGDYLAFLGRMSPEKGPERAIEIARRVGLPLKMAAKIDPVDREYFRDVIEPELDDAQIEFIGEVNEQEKDEFLGNARALVFPINWPEPFGLVMIEAMACGTPVVAFENGSVPEVMRNGQTGFIVHSVDEAVAAVRNIHEISRQECRQYFLDHFCARRMAEGYLKAYERAIQNALPASTEEAIRLPALSREAAAL